MNPQLGCAERIYEIKLAGKNANPMTAVLEPTPGLLPDSQS